MADADYSTQEARRAAFGKMRDGTSDVINFETQADAAQTARIIKADADGVAGAGDVGQAVFRLIDADETETLPKGIGRRAIRSRKRNFQEIAAPRGVVRSALTR